MGNFLANWKRVNFLTRTLIHRVGFPRPPCGAAAQRGPWPSHHVQRRTTVDRTPLGEWSAGRRDLYLKTHIIQLTAHIRALDWIRTRSSSWQAAAGLRLRPRGQFDRRVNCIPYVSQCQSFQEVGTQSALFTCNTQLLPPPHPKRDAMAWRFFANCDIYTFYLIQINKMLHHYSTCWSNGRICQTIMSANILILQQKCVLRNSASTLLPST